MISEIINSSVDFLVSTIGSLGYIGIFLLMALESSIIPVPSELVLIPAGYLVSQGLMSLWIVLLMSLLGSLAGSFASYLIALYFGRRAFTALAKKYGKFIFFNIKTLEKSEKYFENHGEITIFICRLMPVIRHLISLPAGFAKMNLKKFTLYTVIGSTAWSVVLIYIGYFLGENRELIQENLHTLTLAVLIISLIIIIAYILIRRYMEKKS